MPNPKLHSCVNQVKADSDVDEPYAVCKASIGETSIEDIISVEQALINAGVPEETIHQAIVDSFGDTQVEETVNIPGDLSGTSIVLPKKKA